MGAFYLMLMWFLDVNGGSAPRGAFAAAGRRIPYANGYIGKVVIAGGQGRKAYTDIAIIRNDFLQKQSTMLVCENQTICIEDLHVKGMIRNHKLAKSIASVSWAKFFEMLEYKAIWYGNELHRVPTMYPSSQTCSSCGYRNPRIKNLSIRIWECPKCHAVHDRDTNAGINILKKGLQLQSA